MKYVNEFLSFLNTSQSVFHAVNTIEQRLLKEGFIKLYESNDWKLDKGKKYFVTRNDSSIIAFTMPTITSDISYNITATHSDSPAYKLKPNFEINLANTYSNLNTEPYGGIIHPTWMDKPLSVAGRVFVNKNNKISSVLVNIDKDLLVIPTIAPHVVNDISSYKFNPQKDLLPVIGHKSTKTSLYDMLEKQHKIKQDDILSFDLFLYNRFRGCVVGIEDEFITAPQIDNLASAYGSLEGFIQAKNDSTVNIYSSFDNEEIGSRTKQGADSTFMTSVINKINNSLGFTLEQLEKHLNQSLLLSIDNAHALHPAFAEKSDPTNRCYLNEGVVIKHNANQNYTTDALSLALFNSIMNKHDICTQNFTNRSDMRGGGTLGSVLVTQLSINAIDIGLAQLAMHSASETIGSKDINNLVEVTKVFYNSHITKKEDEFLLKK